MSPSTKQLARRTAALLVITLVLTEATPAREAVLVKDVNRNIFSQDGKVIGFVKIPSGVKVTVETQSGDNLMIHREGEPAFKAPKDCVSSATLVAVETPTPTPTPIATPTPAVAVATPTPAPAPVMAVNPPSTFVSHKDTVYTTDGVAVFPSPTPVPTPTNGVVSVNEMNEALDRNLFPPENGGVNLWSEDPNAIANRVTYMKLESKTDNEATWRDAPFNSRHFSFGVQITHTQFRSFKGVPYCFDITFANKGDYTAKTMEKTRNDLKDSGIADLRVMPPKGYIEAIERQYTELKNTLSMLFKTNGTQTILYPGSGREEHGLKWVWNNTAFILIHVPKDYVTVRIMPTNSPAFEYGTDRKNFQEATAQLKNSIITLKEDLDPNTQKEVTYYGMYPKKGAVMLIIPRKHQACRGYCEASAFESILRTSGIYRDSEVVSEGDCMNPGGGGFPNRMAKQITPLINQAGGRITFMFPFRTDVQTVKKYIDRGIPIAWSINTPHAQTIIGYNPETKEIAAIDSHQVDQQIKLQKEGINIPAAYWLKEADAIRTGTGAIVIEKQ